MKKEKQILLRYTTIIILILILLSVIHAKILEFILTIWAFLILKPFFNIHLINNTINFYNEKLLIIDACLGLANYILFALLFFSIDEKYTKICKSYFQSYLLFTLLNFLRIIFLMTIFMIYGKTTFGKIHIFFEFFINAFITAGTFIIIYKKNNLKSKPFIEDLKYLISNIRNK